MAAELGKVDVIEIILKAGVKMDIKDRVHYTLILTWILTNSNWRHHVNGTICFKLQQGKTALGVAARADAVIVVDMIIKAERYFSWIKVNTQNVENEQKPNPCCNIV